MGEMRALVTGHYGGGWGCRWGGGMSLRRGKGADALWAKVSKNADWSTGPHALLLAPHYSLRSHAPLHSFARLLAHFARKLLDGYFSVFFSILAHSVMRESGG